MPYVKCKEACSYKFWSIKQEFIFPDVNYMVTGDYNTTGMAQYLIWKANDDTFNNIMDASGSNVLIFAVFALLSIGASIVHCMMGPSSLNNPSEQQLV